LWAREARKTGLPALWAAYVHMRHRQTRFPVMIRPKRAKVKTPPVAIEDILAYICRGINIADAEGKTLDIADSDVLSYRDTMPAAARQLDRRRPIIPVPAPTPWLSSHPVRPATIVAAPPARALWKSLRGVTVWKKDLALSLFDLEPADFEKTAARALRRSTLRGNGSSVIVKKAMLS